MTLPAITVEQLGKCYHIGRYREKPQTIRAAIKQLAGAPFAYLTDRLRTPSEDEILWALRNVSFEVKQGEVLGIIGRNGAGKSTLLKILSRITDPTEGHARIRGRVNSLLEVGTGFHPELTGRENIFMNAAIHGLRRQEVSRKFDEIVAFSEIEKFIDTPVKRYSSGMYTRLAFGVAAHLEPDILVIDEVLAVGDISFQRKCLGRIGSVAKSGRTVLFVSHNMAAVSALCERVIVLERGCVKSDGPATSAIQDYLRGDVAEGSQDLERRTVRGGTGESRIIGISVSNTRGSSVVATGDELNVEFSIRGANALRNPKILVSFRDQLGQAVYFLDSNDTGGLPASLPAECNVVCQTGEFCLTPGTCSMNIALASGDRIVDHIEQVCELMVMDSDYLGTGKMPTRQTCMCVLRQKWSLK